MFFEEITDTCSDVKRNQILIEELIFEQSNCDGK